MWCICGSSDDEFTDEWENDVENIITNLKQARTLGKTCISKREFGRQEPELENKILELIKEIDQDVLCIKRKAVFFLTTNTDLYNERNQQIEFYKQHAQKQIQFLELEQEVQQLRFEHQAMVEENLKLKDLCKLLQKDNERLRGWRHLEGGRNTRDKSKMSSGNQEFNEDHQEETLVESNQLINDLRQLLSSFDQEQKQLRSQLQSQATDFAKATSSQPPEDVSNSHLYKTRFWLEQKLENQRMLLKQSNLGYTWNRNNKTARNITTKNRVKTFFSKPRRSHRGDQFQTDTTEIDQEEKQRLLDCNKNKENIELDPLEN